MAKFIKGDPISNATAYKLYKVVSGGSDYSLITAQPIGKQSGWTKGEISESGNITTSITSFYKYSQLIDVETLEDFEGASVQVYAPDGNYTNLAAAFYDADGEFILSLTYEELNGSACGNHASDIKEFAKNCGAIYVRFMSYIIGGKPEPWVNLTKSIFFRLDNLYGLTAGETHYLVVKAIAPTDAVDTNNDGKVDTRYLDSEYGGDANRNPLIYTVEDNSVDITDQFAFTENGMINATDGKFSSYSGWVANENYVDISAYSEIEIKMSKTSSTGTGTGLALYDADKNFVSGIPHTDGVATYGTMVKTIQVPSNVKYVRTTYWSTSNSNYKADYGDFYCKATLKA